MGRTVGPLRTSGSMQGDGPAAPNDGAGDSVPVVAKMTVARRPTPPPDAPLPPSHPARTSQGWPAQVRGGEYGLSPDAGDSRNPAAANLASAYDLDTILDFLIGQAGSPRRRSYCCRVRWGAEQQQRRDMSGE